MNMNMEDLVVSSLQFVPLIEPLHSINCHGKPQDIERMRHLIRENPSVVNQVQTIAIYIGVQVEKEVLPLHHAVFHGHLNCVKLLVESGADLETVGPNYDDAEIKTLFEYALDSPKEKMIPHILQILIQNGMPSNQMNVNDSGCSLLAYAMRQKWFNLTKFMIENGSIIDHYNINENCLKVFKYPVYNSPLSIAIKLLDLRTSKLLLINGASLVFNCCQMNYTLLDFIGTCSIPHFFINNCFKGGLAQNEKKKTANQLALTGLYLYQQFGGNLWFKQDYSRYNHEPIDGQLGVRENTEENILDFMNQYPDHIEQIIDLHASLVKMMQNPMDLKNLCRIALLKAMKEKFWRSLEMLEIPVEVREFLKFPDVDMVINSL